MIPMMRSPMSPYPAPRMIWPASHPAITPTTITTKMLSFDMAYISQFSDEMN
jgi:hypothetical protein